MTAPRYAVMGRRAFALVVVLLATAGGVAGVAAGVAIATAHDRVRGLWKPIEWEGVDE